MDRRIFFQNYDRTMPHFDKEQIIRFDMLKTSDVENKNNDSNQMFRCHSILKNVL